MPQISDLIKKTSPDDLFPISEKLANKFIKDIQYHLRQYEKNDKKNNQNERVAALKNMYQAIEYIDIHESPRYLAKARAFLELKKELFSFVQQQIKEIDPEMDMHPEGTARSALSEIMANMSPQKASELMVILDKKHKSPTFSEMLQGLYKDDVSEEATKYNEFLKEHSISFLGGANSINFKVENKNTGKTQILKVDNRGFMPRHIERHLREQMSSAFISNYTERQTEAEYEFEQYSKTIVVTDFCARGDLANYVQQAQSEDEKTEITLDSTQQMANIFINIQNAGCFFPDAKITNWLIDEKGNVQIGDTKSFVFIDKEGNFSQKIPGNEHATATPLQTIGFTDKSTNAEKAHAALLGRNIYACLTSEWPPNGEFNDNHFNKPIFQTAQGLQLKTLIQQLSDPTVSNRISLADAKLQLVAIQIDNNEIIEVIKNLQKLSLGDNDIQMKAYIEKKITELKAATPDERADIIDGMKQTAKGLDEKINHEITDMIIKFRVASQDFFSIGNNKKADRIETALKKIPIEERAILSTSRSGEVNALKEAIASHRHPGRSSPKVQHDGTINEKDTSNSFKMMKNKFKQITQERESQVNLEKQEPQIEIEARTIKP